MTFPCMFLPAVHYSIKCHLIRVMRVGDNSLRWVLLNKLLADSPVGLRRSDRSHPGTAATVATSTGAT